MIRIILPAALLTLWIIFPLPAAAKDGYKRSPGVDIIHYCFRINLNDSTDHIGGSTVITCGISNGAHKVILDLAGINGKGSGMVVDQILAGGSGLVWSQKNNRIEIEIPQSISIPGFFTFTVQYSGIPADGLIISQNKFGKRTFFGDNWPDRARNWIPCVDHPSDKATVEFIVTAPEKYQVVSNGYLAGEHPDTSLQGNRMKVTHWKEDVPIPTKVMVIGVAEFAWELSGFSKGIPVQAWVYPENREAGFTDYRPAAEILTFYQELIGPYSYVKLANVQSKTMFGGMENSGCIFYSERSVTGKNQLHGLLAHEIAHQWFGDAVTEGDWHHIWLSEGFATYLEAVYADSLIPGRKLPASMADMRKEVIRYYVRTGKPVLDTTITNNMDLLSTNSYQKGAWVLHMLRQELGDRLFWTGLRQFYEKFRDRNAMSSDFQAVMEQVSGRSLGEFFRQWLEIPGHPVIQWSWRYNEREDQVEIDLEQIQSHHSFVFSLPLELRGNASVRSNEMQATSVIYRVPVAERKVRIKLPADFPVTEIRLDPDSRLLFEEKLAGK